MRFAPFLIASLLPPALLSGCTISDDASGSDAALPDASEAAACVTVTSDELDPTCTTDSDCTYVPVGVLCEQPCCDPGQPANITSAARINPQIATLPDCSSRGPCGAVNTALCCGGRCSGSIVVAGPAKLACPGDAGAPDTDGADSATPPNDSRCPPTWDEARTMCGQALKCDPPDNGTCGAPGVSCSYPGFGDGNPPATALATCQTGASPCLDAGPDDPRWICAQ